ncbi:MAG: DUF4292 domain-containing protein [Spirosomaceae bacterium]|jgi:hypothetical protein|nr:DUF4292 domain-containing protein [Spirosomataceae bacterium]
MIQKNLSILLILFVFSLSACKRNAHKKKIEKENEVIAKVDSVETQKVEKLEVLKTEETPKVTVEPAEVDFKYLKIKSKVDFKGAGEDQSFPATIQIKKDSVIWISVAVGLEVARGIITRDSIVFLDRIHRNYYKFDFNSLSEQFNFNLNYDLVQSLLIGNMPIRQRQQDSVSKEERFFKILQDLKILQLENYIAQDNLKLVRLFGKTANAASTINVGYGEFQNINTVVMPQSVKVQIDAQSNAKEINTMINLQHNRIDFLEESPGFPFTIPKTYQQVFLKR